MSLVGLPMALRLIPPNRLFGVRTAHTLASPDVWYLANFRAGVTAVVLGLIGTVFVARVSVQNSTGEAKVGISVSTTIFIAVATAIAGLSSALGR
jgi:uncharacterized membrane protein